MTVNVLIHSSTPAHSKLHFKTWSSTVRCAVNNDLIDGCAGRVVLHKREVSLCDDEASSVWYRSAVITLWLVRDTTLTGAQSLLILYPGYGPSVGSFLSLPPLLSPPSFFLLFFVMPLPIHYSLSLSHYLLLCSLLFLLCSTFLFSPFSNHPPSWIKLFIWSKPQPAGKQAVSTEAKAEGRQLQTTLCRAGMKHVSHW